MSEEIKKFIEGIKKFREKFFNPTCSVFDDLVLNGQKPKTMLIACSDSRVDPAMILNSQPGDLFVIRNMANLIPPCEDNTTYHGTSAALQFGVCFLEVQNIIIVGHTQCGGIQALLKNGEGKLNELPASFISKWMDLARPAYNRVMASNAAISFEEKVILCEQYALVNSLHNLQTFPWIEERVKNGKLLLHAWYFDLATGVMHMYDQQQENWIFL